MAGRLVFSDGKTELRSVSLEEGQSVVIGRGPNADVRFEDSMPLSRTHCRVWDDGEGTWIEGLNNRGGIIVSGKGIRGAHRLQPGDVVTLLGDLQFQLS